MARSQLRRWATAAAAPSRRRLNVALRRSASDVGAVIVEAAAADGWTLEVETDRGGVSFPNFLPDPSAVPVIDGRLGLSRWQNIFLCEFDGPRSDRSVVVTVIADA